MKTYLDCLPCFLRQPLEASRMATVDEAVHAKVLSEVLVYLQNIPYHRPPPAIARDVQSLVKTITGCKDPYKEVKLKSNRMVEDFLPELEKTIEKSKDPLRETIKYAIIGNVIDYGSVHRFDISEMMHAASEFEIDPDVYKYFKGQLKKAQTVLYLADNAGEIFFDKLLIKHLKALGKNVFVAVKSQPILNDATEDDAQQANLKNYSTVISADNGKQPSAPGVLLSDASEEFLRIFDSADIVISKGQGNYESLDLCEREIFFLLVVKCPLVSSHLKTSVGDLVFTVNIHET